jgi:phosphate starvation-inducible PhoH-like protein
MEQILQDIKGVRFVYFSSSDVVRHPLVQKIVDAYQRYENEQGST